MTILLIACNIGVFAYQIWLARADRSDMMERFALVPVRVEHVLERSDPDPAAALLPLLTSVFLHGGLLHIAGNMLFLWVFGAAVEDYLGHFRYLMFYLMCGFAASMTHVAFDWGSTTPSVGASGAISGVMGAYMVLFPWSRISTLVPLLFFFFKVSLPAFLMVGYWFVIQILSALGDLAQTGQGGVAWWAHVGGFVSGLLLVLVIGKRR